MLLHNGLRRVILKLQSILGIKKRDQVMDNLKQHVNAAIEAIDDVIEQHGPQVQVIKDKLVDIRDFLDRLGNEDADADASAQADAADATASADAPAAPAPEAENAAEDTAEGGVEESAPAPAAPEAPVAPAADASAAPADASAPAPEAEGSPADVSQDAPVTDDAGNVVSDPNAAH